VAAGGAIGRSPTGHKRDKPANGDSFGAVTGMIVDNIDQARIASVQVAALDRRKVRRRFEERFTAHRMASDYVRVYRKLAHPAARPRDVKYQTNGGARISEELISDEVLHAD